MKKFLAILLAGILGLSLVACGQQNDSKTEDSKQEESKSEIADALALLQAVWGSYTEDETFAAIGGDMTEGNLKENAPGRYGLQDEAEMNRQLGLPEGWTAKLQDAASLMHMLNVNTFTCGAYHLQDAADAEALAAALKTNIMQRQWMCGFPDKLVVITVDDYVVSCFGAQNLVDTFATKLTTLYSGAKIVSDDPVVA